MLFQQKEPLVKADTWFTQEVIAQGNHLIVRVNGQTVADRWHEDGPLAGCLALQVYQQQTIVHFEKVEIKELPPIKDKWISLFNGKDLTGWKTHRLSPSSWTVEDGDLVARVKDPICSAQRRFPRFIFAEVKMTAKADGGIHFGTLFGLSVDKTGLWPIRGYQAQLGLPASTGSLNKFGGPFKTLHRAPAKMHEADKWFDMEVIVKNKHVQILVNGKIATDYHDPAFSPPLGHITLQWTPPKESPGAEIRFRKIEINEVPQPVIESDWVQLFNGKDLDGWKIHSDKPGTWKVENGLLVGRDGPSYLHTPATITGIFISA